MFIIVIHLDLSCIAGELQSVLPLPPQTSPYLIRTSTSAVQAYDPTACFYVSATQVTLLICQMYGYVRSIEMQCRSVYPLSYMAIFFLRARPLASLSIGFPM